MWTQAAVAVLLPVDCTMRLINVKTNKGGSRSAAERSSQRKRPMKEKERIDREKERMRKKATVNGKSGGKTKEAQAGCVFVRRVKQKRHSVDLSGNQRILAS